jgi:hypothetical protein
MADFASSIEKLKELIKTRARKTSQITGSDPNPKLKTTDESIIYKPPSSWMKSLEYFPMAKAQSGSVIMRARGPNVGYIYPRVGKIIFNKWVSNNWRGGFIYWYGTPSLRDYSIIARKARPFRRGGTGRLAMGTIAKRKHRGTKYNQIPENIRQRGVRTRKMARKQKWRL